MFTLVDLDESRQVTAVSLVENGGHEAGGCMVPVGVLKEAGADAIIVGGMGARPMQGFAGVGIKVFFANREQVKSAKDAVEQFANDKLPVMHPEQVCKGSDNCNH